MRCVRNGLKPARALPAAIAAALVLAAMASPADARRAKRAAPTGGYNPPYAAMVVDVKSGRTLHAVNEDALRHPASVTKVMTLYLLFEQLERGRMSLETPLNVSANASRQAPSKLGLRPGSTIDVEDAIGAIVTKSANDVAVVIAENVGGSEEAFAEMMTRKAHALGMSRTHYSNASGLPDPDQVTTARDLTVLARAIQDRFPRYYRYFQTRSFQYAGRTIGNHNRLIGTVEGVDGIKTGYTRASGFNLMTSARLNDRHVVGIVLGGRSGASRDRIMADLVRSNLPRAMAGLRTAPSIVEVAERARPAVVAEAPPRPARTLLASADADEAVTTASIPARGAPLDITPRGATTTPGASKWSSGGSTAVPPAAQAFAPLPPVAERPPVERAGKYDARIPAVDAATLVARTDKAEAKPEAARRETAKSEAPAREAALPARPATVTPWVIQLGAMDDEAKAKSMLAEARSQGGRLTRAAPFTEKVVHGGTTLFRARFSGFSEAEDAQDACRALKRGGFTCFATRS